MNELDKLNQLHIKVMNKPKEWRLGQAYFNYAYELFPLETDQLRGTKFDCFYLNDRINIFIEELEKLIIKSKSF